MQLGYALAAVIGLSLGILGGGGSILTVPVFVFVMGFAPKTAIAMSLPVVGTTSLVGAISHWRAGSFHLRYALAFGIAAMAGALVSARLAAFVPGVVQLTLLGVVMLVAAVLMLRGSGNPPNAAATEARHPALIAVTGFGVGLLTGLVGVGGGFLFVPALVLLAGLPIKTAVGTSLLVIALNTSAALFGYKGQVDIPWNVVALFTAIAIVGSLTGARLVRFVPAQTLRRGFAYFLIVMAGFILYENRAVLAHPAASLKPSNVGATRR